MPSLWGSENPRAGERRMSHRCTPDGKKKKRHRKKKKPSNEKLAGTYLRSKSEMREMEQETIKRIRRDDQKTTKSAIRWAEGDE